MRNTKRLVAGLILGASAFAIPIAVSAQDAERNRPAASEGPRSQAAHKSDDRPERKNRQSAEREGKEQPANEVPRKSEQKSERPKQADTQDRTDRDKADSSNANKSSDNTDLPKKSQDDAQQSASESSKKGAAEKAEGAKNTDVKTEGAKNADLSGDKKERVATSLKKQGVKELTNVNIDVSVGRRLPRDWEYHDVPAAVIEVVPAYRGYRYAFVDGRYVIVEPDSYEVVYIVDDRVGGSAVGRATGESGTGAGQCGTGLTFSDDDRDFIFENVRKTDSRVKIDTLEIGARLPGDVRVEMFPSDITTRVSQLGACRYVVVDDRLAIIDPDDEKIVAIIED